MEKGVSGTRAVGQVIRMWRLIRGLRQVDLQTKARLPQGRVSKIETGELSPTLDDLRAIAGMLRVPVAEMVRVCEQIDDHVMAVLEEELATRETSELEFETAARLIQGILDRVGADGDTG